MQVKFRRSVIEALPTLSPLLIRLLLLGELWAMMSKMLGQILRTPFTIAIVMFCLTYSAMRHA